MFFLSPWLWDIPYYASLREILCFVRSEKQKVVSETVDTVSSIVPARRPEQLEYG